ncbi:ATP-dependent endonuclease of the OLD family- like protein [Salinarchaeum sp. Harcht-Bsk1]|uniref:ATP-dependent nuclease n=1 Tax=Salinarchaeum sp. Harcht-Bsk1 TaxID=1333523 RepID=UPI0003422F14|nr:AAA family ATPase [Salinarchaeum sp. Harcht-Bsk1]AGN01201.1 ATP-dependent endonuclease of the OLD family- like protein [Salinarchaeum sp. Harcht-Bsk1]
MTHMQLSELHVENFKSIEETHIDSVDDLSVLVGKNDAGKSSVLEAVKMFLEEKGKPERDQFHMECDDDIVITAFFEDVPAELADCLNDSIELTNGRLKISRRWEYPEDSRSMADTYLGPDEEQLGAGTLVGDHESDGKRDTRQYLWKLLPDPIYIPAERNIAEETKFKSDTLIDQLLTPLLEENDDIRSKRNELESELNDGVDGLQTDIEDRLTDHVDSISQLELVTGDINLGKAFSPSIQVTDEFSEISVPIAERGSGVGSLLVLSLVETYRERQVGEGYVMLFEEPGNWLHPEAKRRMLGALKRISENGGQVMLSTHSPIFIDRRGHGDVFLVQRHEGKTSVREIEENYLTIVEELGARNSDILQSDFVVYVEGITDVQMVEIVADNYLNETERARITIQHLGGGGNIQQCSLSDLSEINRTFGFLLDSDKSDPEDTEKDYIDDLREENESIEPEVVIEVLEKREIENYFTPEGVNEALRLEVDSDFIGDFEDIPDKLGAEVRRHHAGESVPPQADRTCDECGRIEHPGKGYHKSKGKDVVAAMYDQGQCIEPVEDFFDEVKRIIDA